MRRGGLSRRVAALEKRVLPPPPVIIWAFQTILTDEEWTLVYHLANRPGDDHDPDRDLGWPDEYRARCADEYRARCAEEYRARCADEAERALLEAVLAKERLGPEGHLEMLFLELPLVGECGAERFST
jgi:hypothetical protein